MSGEPGDNVTGYRGLDAIPNEARDRAPFEEVHSALTDAELLKIGRGLAAAVTIEEQLDVMREGLRWLAKLLIDAGDTEQAVGVLTAELAVDTARCKVCEVGIECGIWDGPR